MSIPVYKSVLGLTFFSCEGNPRDRETLTPEGEGGEEKGTSRGVEVLFGRPDQRLNPRPGMGAPRDDTMSAGCGGLGRSSGPV